MILLALVCVGGLLLDPRTLLGQPIWAKPLKFSVSFVLYLPTLAWMISLVRGARTKRVASVAGTVVAVMSVIEMVAIVGQVVRGRASHFDVATPFDTAVWAVMGTSIAVLWVANLVIAAVLLRERSLPPTTAWAVRLGLVVALIGMAVAFLMTSPSGYQIDQARTTGSMTSAGAHASGSRTAGPGCRWWGGRRPGVTCDRALRRPARPAGDPVARPRRACWPAGSRCWPPSGCAPGWSGGRRRWLGLTVLLTGRRCAPSP